MNIIRWHSCVRDNYVNSIASCESSPIARWFEITKEIQFFTIAKMVPAK